MRYAVTGAAGFIGSHLAEALVAAGHEVVGFDSFTDYYDPALKRRTRAGSTCGGSTWVKLRSISAASTPSSTSPASPAPAASAMCSLTTCGGTARDAARLRGGGRGGDPVVWASSSSVYGDAERYPTSEDVEPRPNNPYGVTKLSCEHLHDTYERLFGLRAVALRYFTVYGPRQRPDMAFARMVAAAASDEEFELYGDGSQSRSFTFVSDVVDATVLALGAPPGIYNVGGGEEYTMRDALELLEDVSGRPVRVRYGPPQTGDNHRTKADTTRIEQAIAGARRRRCAKASPSTGHGCPLGSAPHDGSSTRRGA